MTSPLAWVRRSQRMIRMVSELHRLGYQQLRIFPYEYPLAWRLCVAPRSVFAIRNGAYVWHNHAPPGIHRTTYTSASGNAYFNWPDAAQDDARALAAKFLSRFPAVSAQGQGRDWEYAGWLCELLGVIERGSLLPFVMSEYFEPEPLALSCLPIRDFSDHSVRLDFPLPPPGARDTQ